MFLEFYFIFCLVKNTNTFYLYLFRIDRKQFGFLLDCKVHSMDSLSEHLICDVYSDEFPFHWLLFMKNVETMK